MKLENMQMYKHYDQLRSLIRRSICVLFALYISAFQTVLVWLAEKHDDDEEPLSGKTCYITKAEDDRIWAIRAV